jgi:hypothetical protein
MRKAATLSIAFLAFTCSYAQTFKFKQHEIQLHSFYSKSKELTKKDTLTFIIEPQNVISKGNEVSIKFLLETNSIDATYKKPILCAPSSIIFDSITWNKAVEKGKSLDVNLLIDIPASDITLKSDQFAQLKGTIGEKSESLIVRYINNPDDDREPTLPTPQGFTYLNAINFDFENSNGTSYVGHLNIFKPNLFSFKKNNKTPEKGMLGWLGLNFGILKIDYSKRDSGVNNSKEYVEYAKINPLDSPKVGTPYFKQYNRITNSAKNNTLSFYFQPMVTLVSNTNTKLLFHLHTELFINKWTVTTTLNNLQQLIDTIRSSNVDTIKKVIIPINKFVKSTSDPIVSQSENTTLTFGFGFGLTFHQRLWHNGYLFVQPTFGIVTAYSTPQSVNANTLTVSNDTDKAWFHLTRVEVKQELTATLQAVIGLNVVGKFTKEPSYAAYIGLNLGLDAIRKILQ